MRRILYLFTLSSFSVVLFIECVKQGHQITHLHALTFSVLSCSKKTFSPQHWVVRRVLSGRKGKVGGCLKKGKVFLVKGNGEFFFGQRKGRVFLVKGKGVSEVSDLF